MADPLNATTRDSSHSPSQAAGYPSRLAKDWLPKVIHPALHYEAAPLDFAVLACFFDSEGYESKLTNMESFVHRLREANIQYRIVECAFGNDAFRLPQSPNVIRLRARDVLWQKERLLNVGMQSLPPNITKVAWIDGDILFARGDWAIAAACALDEYPVIQLFSDVVRLPRFASHFSGDGDAWESFAKVWRREPHTLKTGDYFLHGHTGFAWAARRSLLSTYGLYDACISGSADHLMAHAFCGDMQSECTDRIFDRNSRHFAHFQSWARRVGDAVQGRLGTIDGTILHLWHGAHINRQYVKRNEELASFEFDPLTDIRVGIDGSWEWASPKPDLHSWARAYYASRKEDGDS